MKALIIGFGSIGSLHAEVLIGMGLDALVVSRRDIDFPSRLSGIVEGLDWNSDYVVIATCTADHQDNLRVLAEYGYSGLVLVEKPLFRDMPEAVPAFPFDLFVGYNLRFHPVIEEFKARWGSERFLSCHAYCGQILESWRKGRPSKFVYSASRAGGGGVLRDLSHELDLLIHLFGPVRQFKALGGRVSDQTIDSDDVYGFLMQMEKCPLVTLQINYLDRVSRRELLLNSASHSLKLDVVRKTVEFDGESMSFICERADTYRKMHRELLEGDRQSLCSFEEALKVQELISIADRQQVYECTQLDLVTKSSEREE
ncbi:MAG TPA: gfo/Idh/MocA family oxidoreductase [Candidatus Melainabacteria bacterium]|nr:gfo/Idh/MocA family oxidoreductase [Candidatus Melainabacteria bacterium]